MHLSVPLISLLLLAIGVSSKHIVKLTAHDIADIEARYDSENTVEERESAKRVRDGVRQVLMKMKLRDGEEHSHAKRAAAEQDTEETLQLIQEAKRAVHRSMGLSEKIEPRNDGLWQGDILLRKDEAEKYILEYGGMLPKKSRARRSVFSPDASKLVRRWSSPIKYYIDNTTTAAAGQILLALNQITTQLPCLVFQPVTSQPSNGSYLQFTMATGMSGCGGYAYVGMQTSSNSASDLSYNPVAVDVTGATCTQWTSGPLTNTSANMIITHETFHALGMSHEQQRGDMANFISINKSNVQAAQWSQFAQDSNNSYTTYGQTYNYYSIMHYAANSYAINTAINTMIATLQPIAQNTAAMGNPGGQIANISDIIILNATYCQNNNTYTMNIINITTSNGLWAGNTPMATTSCDPSDATTAAAVPANCPSGYTQLQYQPAECVVCTGACSTPQPGDDWAAQAYRMQTNGTASSGTNQAMSISVRQCQSNTPVCADQYTLCGYWAQQGQCSSPTITTQCPKSCATPVCSKFYNNGSS